MCLRFAGDGQRGQVGSSPYHWLRFEGEGRTSYVARKVKLMWNASMPISSLQENFLLSIPSHLIHSPCLACETAFAHLVACSCRRTSSTTSRRRWAGAALCHDGLLSPRPRPPYPCCTMPMMSLCLRSDFAWWVAAVGFHFLPVTRVGAVWETHGSRDSVSVISSLTLEHLNSSVRLEIGISRMPLPYSPMLVKHLGSPSHFLANELTTLSSFSTFEIGTS